MRPWRRLSAERFGAFRIFDLDRVRYERPSDGASREFLVVDAPDWINVIPLTDDDRVVVVRQFRFGVDGVTLEIPGGMCDRGEDPREAARRELREETGYDARDFVSLGSVHPNPAIQNNRCHTFLARGAFRAGDPQPDENEEIAVETVPLDDVPKLIADGTISHALVVAAFYRLGILSPR